MPGPPELNVQLLETSLRCCCKAYLIVTKLRVYCSLPPIAECLDWNRDGRDRFVGGSRYRFPYIRPISSDRVEPSRTSSPICPCLWLPDSTTILPGPSLTPPSLHFTFDPDHHNRTSNFSQRATFLKKAAPLHSYNNLAKNGMLRGFSGALPARHGADKAGGQNDTGEGCRVLLALDKSTTHRSMSEQQSAGTSELLTLESFACCAYHFIYAIPSL
jgi:hypothetical protein